MSYRLRFSHVVFSLFLLLGVSVSAEPKAHFEMTVSQQYEAMPMQWKSMEVNTQVDLAGDRTLHTLVLRGQFLPPEDDASLVGVVRLIRVESVTDEYGDSLVDSEQARPIDPRFMTANLQRDANGVYTPVPLQIKVVGLNRLPRIISKIVGEGYLLVAREKKTLEIKEINSMDQTFVTPEISISVTEVEHEADQLTLMLELSREQTGPLHRLNRAILHEARLVDATGLVHLGKVRINRSITRNQDTFEQVGSLVFTGIESTQGCSIEFDFVTEVEFQSVPLELENIELPVVTEEQELS